MYIFHKTE